MRGTMAGRDVRAIREALRLPVSQFSTVLGVHPSSVHRWEAADRDLVPIEGVAWPVLTALRQRVDEDPGARRRAAQAGRDVAAALITGGVIVALTALLLYAAKGKGR